MALLSTLYMDMLKLQKVPPHLKTLVWVPSCCSSQGHIGSNFSNCPETSLLPMVSGLTTMSTASSSTIRPLFRKNMNQWTVMTLSGSENGAMTNSLTVFLAWPWQNSIFFLFRTRMINSSENCWLTGSGWAYMSLFVLIVCIPELKDRRTADSPVLR